MANYAMLFDYKLCINCHACEIACKNENGIELGAKNHRLWIEEDFDNLKDFFNLDKMRFLQMQCQECQDAPCIKACPSEAIYIDENKIIRINKQRCDLSLKCQEACPYDALMVDEKNKTIDKCIFCADTRLARGEMTTACVEACPSGVRIFGDLDELFGGINEILRKRKSFQLKTELKTKPKLYYLL